MKISLNGTWKLTGAWPYTPVLGKSLETGGALNGLTADLPATVPGSVYADLLAAGVIDDPLVADNSLKSEWVESKWWIYERSFDAPALRGGARALLCFDGLDYMARIYLNGAELARHEGTCIPLELDVTQLLLRDVPNVLRVAFEETPREVAIGRTSEVRTQKPRFGYKWDFGTRLVNVGIWDEVYLRVCGLARMTETFVSSDYDGETGSISVSVWSDAPARLEARVTAPEGSVYRALSDQATEHSVRFLLDAPALWYPAGYGAQPLYRVDVSLFDESGLSDAETCFVGVRSVAFSKNEGADADALPYTVLINGKRIYIKGVNLVPFDHLYGCVTEARYEAMLRLIADANVNLVRVWGGGLIEKEIFYSLCDRLGILIWQEFTQSGAGVESVPSEDVEFMKLLGRAAESAVKRRRNHTSLAVWCGGNELRIRPGEDTPVTMDNKNVRLLNHIVRRHDPARMFYPSSASGPFEFINEGVGHDVHGFWRYLGVREHYRMYNECDNLLHSEYGVDGMSSAESVALALGQHNPGVHDMQSNLLWRFHGEWWDNLAANRALFGEFSCLDDFVVASQLMQAEGLRYIAEADQRRAFHNSGTIVWQFNEPWRNVSCTNIVEYDGKPKLAYYALKNAFAPVAVSLKYDTIAPRAGDMQVYQVHLSSFGHPGAYRVTWEALDEQDGVLLKGEAEVHTGDGSMCVADFALCAPEGLYFVKLSAYAENQKIHDNAYFFSTEREAPFRRMIDIVKRRDFS